MRSVEVELSWRNPDCGNCFEEVEHDGEGYICSRCQISWGSEGSSSADYVDDETPPCGEPWPHPTPVLDHWDGTRGPMSSVRHDYPCDLPAGHNPAYHHHPHLYIHCRQEAS